MCRTLFLLFDVQKKLKLFSSILPHMVIEKGPFLCVKCESCKRE